MTPEMQEVIQKLVRDNPEAGRAKQAMVDRGLSGASADAEVAKVLTAHLWERSHGLTTDPKRLDTALQALANGHSADELFPDELNEDGGNSPAT